MIGTIMMQVVGYSIFVGLLCGICKAHSRRWTRVANVYTASNPSVLQLAWSDCKRMQTVFLTGGTVGWNSYKGIITVAVTSEGIWFRIMRPFTLFHAPLLIPFRDVQITPIQWYLIGSQSFQLTLRGVSDVRIVIDSNLLDWIRQRAEELAVEFTNDPDAVSVPAVEQPERSPEMATSDS